VLLGGRYVDDEVRGYYDSLPRFPSVVQVSLGVARDPSAEPHHVSFPLDEPLRIVREAVDRLALKHYCYDTTLAPAGKSMLTMLIPSSYEPWKRLSEQRERYDAEEEEVAAAVIARLGRRFPGLAGQVEVVDVATPLTYERYTGNWEGCFEGWLPTAQTIRVAGPSGMKKTLPGLGSFHMVGQWVEPGGGPPPAATSGRRLIETLCREGGRRFVAGVP
jgi:phytoene dehydrogenase-like protein